MRKKSYYIGIYLALMAGMAGCGQTQKLEAATTAAIENTTITTAAEGTKTSNTVQTTDTAWDTEFTARDLEVGYEEADATKIIFSDTGIEVEGSGVSAEGTILTIQKEGVYVFSGSCKEGQIIVNTSDTEKVQIVLKNLELHCENQSPLYIKKADKVFLTLEEGSKNSFSDGTEYILEEENNTLDGVIFSKADLTINGSGALEIIGNYKHGIVSKDDLVITGGDISVTAVNGGLYGKDCVKIKEGNFTLTTGTNAIKSDNEEDADRGYVYISGGNFVIQTDTDGIKAQNMIWITGGSFQVNTKEDTIHSNGDILIEGGEITLTAGDDAVHGDGDLLIRNGKLNILQSYEGLEGATVTIEGGEISLVASDDGINAAGGSDEEETTNSKTPDTFRANSNNFIKITGGTVTVDASGDGIDSNGNFYMDGGTVYVNGPTNSGNGALDYDGEAIITGGQIIAVGSLGMAQNFGTSSTQCAFLYGFTEIQKQGSTITLTDSEGAELFQYTPIKDYQSLILSLPELKEGNVYYLSSGESEKIEITLETTISSIGTSGFGRGGMGTPGNRGNGERQFNKDMEGGEMGIPPEGMENESIRQRPENGEREFNKEIGGEIGTPSEEASNKNLEETT